MKTIKLLQIVKIAVLICIGIVIFPIIKNGYNLVEGVFATSRIESSVLTMIKSEDLNFLVTNRITSQIVVQISENSPLLGQKEGALIGIVTMYYGIDLSKLTKDSISKNGNTITIKVPHPEELDFSVDPSSLKYITKMSGLNLIADYFYNRNFDAELRDRMEKSAEKFFTDHKMYPSNDAILKRLDSYFAPLTSEYDTHIIFKYN